jgi:sucrose-6-phosphate hydrolase SacC (GH32 family)
MLATLCSQLVPWVQAVDAWPPDAPPLVDKTLVVWAAPANLDQRGGSALTLEDGRNHFDAIVLGELAPARWMAGSDFYHRTLKEQESIPAETASPETFVQIAVVYAGREVTIYRNGQLYARHAFSGEPRSFGPASHVGIGKRHRRQGGSNRFAGAIEDARIYDRALTREQIAALEPDQPGDIAPWAWWSFDSPEAKDRTGRFPQSQLTAGARIEKGRLLLDGATSDFTATTGREVPFVTETPTRPSPVPKDWLSFHLAHPGPGTAMPGDPNCAFYWKGRYHLHYIYASDDGFAFAHVSSPDMVRWKWHPTTLTPTLTGHGMFSGTGFFTKDGRPAIIYHGEGSGRNQIAIALDDSLEKWSPPVPLEPVIQPAQDSSTIAHWDPDAWIDGSHYYALSGGSPGSGKPPTLFRSPDLQSWDFLGLFLSHDMPDVKPDEDISCPNFFRIGQKHMLLCISHTLGCRYYLGDWKNEKFTPDFHARMNWHAWDFFAPESLLTPDGRRIMWAWCNLGHPQSGIQSLPRELSLPDDGILRITPLRELQSLRHQEQHLAHLSIPPDSPLALPLPPSDAFELDITFQPGPAHSFGVNVLADPNGHHGFPVTVDHTAQSLRLGPTTIPFPHNTSAPVTLRLFVDKNVIEVFANDRQAAIASHRAPENHLHLSLSSHHAPTSASLTTWNLHPIYAPNP